MRPDNRKRDVHALDDNGMVVCNPRDREASHRARVGDIATGEGDAVSCTKCIALVHQSRKRDSVGNKLGADGTVSIRLATAPDIRSVREVMHRAHAWNVSNGFNFTAGTIAEHKLRPAVKARRLYVGELGERIVCCIELTPEPAEGDWSFHWLAVDPDVARRGLGRLMISHVEVVARLRGGRRMILDTPETHPSLPQYYSRLGYAAYDTIQWEDKRYRSVLMVKRLV